MVNWKDYKYDKLVGKIEEEFNNSKDWDRVKSLINYTNLGLTRETALSVLGVQTGLNEELTYELWVEVAEGIESSRQERKINKLGAGAINDASIPKGEGSTWQTYKAKLRNQGWTEESINNIEESAFSILQNLSMDLVEYGPVKGLSIGSVQSGKTANMVGLMAMAADNGFNYFVVLSGVIESLRLQTASRFKKDLDYISHINDWVSVDNPDKAVNDPSFNINTFDLSPNSNKKYYSVILKNYRRLDKFIKWLTTTNPEKTKQLKVLVIDDEGDQASINTNKIDDENPSKINELLRKLVNNKQVKAMNYIAYTATPYANVLNEGENPDAPTLYPKDFIMVLDTNDDYIGPSKLFSIQEPESQADLNIIREITESDSLLIKEFQKGETQAVMPESLKDAVNWFILSVAAMRTLKFKKPISMLIHTSYKIDHHTIMYKLIQDYLLEQRKNYNRFKNRIKDQYIKESQDFTRDDFLLGMKNYSSPKSVPDYPSWEDVEIQVDYLFGLNKKEFLSGILLNDEGVTSFHEGIHLVEDNSKPRSEDQKVRLVYPREEQMPDLAPAFIVIGGNTLSRGLTLEGLVSTYFLRTTNQADTLMQMGRWFGYRKKYEIFPRIWLERIAVDRYEFINQINYELKQEILMMAERGDTPMDYAPLVKYSPNRQLIKVTSESKQQGAIAGSFDFAGTNLQTIYFENNLDILTHNIDVTKDFLYKLGEPKLSKSNSKLIWQNVEKSIVRDYLKNYHSNGYDKKFITLEALLDWIELNSKEAGKNIEGWNILLSSTDDITQPDHSTKGWEVDKYFIKPVRRSRKKNREIGNTISIGALRSPIDLIEDVLPSEEQKQFFNKNTNMSNVYAIRKTADMDNVPLLIIYRIDKDSKALTKNREDLNFLADPIGISLLMPGITKSRSAVQYIKVNLDISDNIDQTEFEEDK